MLPRFLPVALSLSFLALGPACTAPGAAVSDSAQAVAPADAAVALYILLGQSNMVGGGNKAYLAPENKWAAEPYDMAYAEELNCPKDGTLGPCSLSTPWEPQVKPHSLSSYTGAWMGIEMTAGRRLLERFGPDVAMLKHATNGSSLASNWDSTNTNRTLYHYATDYIDARLAELPAGSHVAGMFWIQGEGDSNAALAAGDYAENLTFFITRLRQDYGDFPVVASRTRSGLFQATLAIEQDAAATMLDGLVLVETSDLAMRTDSPPHYTVDSFVTLGGRMADAMPAPVSP